LTDGLRVSVPAGASRGSVRNRRKDRASSVRVVINVDILLRVT